MSLYAGIEAGGTKFICGVGDSEGSIIDQIQFPTTTPDETMPQVIQFLQQHPDIVAIGFGSFGPICLDKLSKDYGKIMKTPKLAWQYFDVVHYLQQYFPDLPVGFDTDVNAAALGEKTWGAAKGLSDVVYITVGTGIGTGIISNNKMVHGLTHPEAGHIRVMRSEHEIDGFTGICPSHQNCLEGMASGPALNSRWQVPSCSSFPENHIAWEIEADYLAQALVNYILIVSPQKIIFGGGVMKQSQLFPKIYKRVQALLNGYISHPLIEENINQYIVPAALGGNAGLKGSIALALHQKVQACV